MAQIGANLKYVEATSIFTGASVGAARAGTILAHGVVGGLAAAANGADRAGVLGGIAAGAVGKSFSIAQGAAGINGVVSGTVINAIAGGTASRLSGGKFESGAVTAAMINLFNHHAIQDTLEAIYKEFWSDTLAMYESIAYDSLSSAADAADVVSLSAGKITCLPICAGSTVTTSHSETLFDVVLEGKGVRTYNGSISVTVLDMGADIVPHQNYLVTKAALSGFIGVEASWRSWQGINGPQNKVRIDIYKEAKPGFSVTTGAGKRVR